MIEMEVVAVQPEPSSNHPLVWLKDKDQRVFLPIAIGNFEAIAIFMELYNEPPPRPITYDLLRSIIDGFHVRVEQVFINALKDETYYAEITLMRDGQSICIDSRPSDALALALRVDAPIFVADQVIEEAGLPVKMQEALENDLLVALGDDHSAVSANDQAEQQVVALKARLQEAVAQEEYEEAATLRDEIGRLEHRVQNR
jgi:hypothetical protein